MALSLTGRRANRVEHDETNSGTVVEEVRDIVEDIVLVGVFEWEVS